MKGLNSGGTFLQNQSDIQSHTLFAVDPHLKLVEGFGNGSVRELYERSIYERSFTSEPSIEKYKAKPASVNKSVINNKKSICVCVFVFQGQRYVLYVASTKSGSQQIGPDWITDRITEKMF